MTQDNQDKPTTPPVKSSHSSTVSHPSKNVLILFSVVSISLVFAIVYTHLHVKQMLAKHTQQIEQQQTFVQQTNQHILQQFQDTTQARIQGIDEALNKALANQQAQAPSWTLFKARYYLELASINNLWTDDKQTTIALLLAADQLLISLKGTDVTSIRQAIADERAALLAVPVPDVTGIMTTLHTLQQTIDTMQPLRETSLNTKLTITHKPFSTLTWREHLQQAWQTLRSLIIIHHHDDPLTNTMTPTYVAMQRAAIRLNLAEAQAAVLQHQTDLYQLMLKQAHDNLLKLFDPNHEKTKAVIKLLDTLQQVKLTYTKPSLKVSAQRLNQLIESQPLTDTTMEKST